MSIHPVLKEHGSLPPGLFTGSDFDAERDEERLLTQLGCILIIVMDGRWRTGERLGIELRRKYPAVRFPDNSTQAQLRNLRKLGYPVEKRNVADAGVLYEYRVLPVPKKG